MMRSIVLALFSITLCSSVITAKKAPLIFFDCHSTASEDDYLTKPPFVAKNPKLIPFNAGVWNKNGYKDRSGTIVIKAIYRWASPFNDYGIAPVAIDKPRTTKKHTPYAKGQIDNVVPGNPLGCFYINEQGQKIADAYEIDNGWDYPTRDGFVRITKDGKIGIMHISGKILVVPQYTTLWRLRESRLWIAGRGQKVHRDGHGCTCGDTEFGGTYGLLDHQGKEIAPITFSKIVCFAIEYGGEEIIPKEHWENIKTRGKLLVLYDGKKAYVLYRKAKNELGIRRESLYDEDRGTNAERIKEAVIALDVYVPKTHHDK